jgi:rRNA maturation endonuclease Nob1
VSFKKGITIMSKEIENRTCDCCESRYKLVYDLNETSGFSKFCPFCGSETHNEEPPEDEDDSN